MAMTDLERAQEQIALLERQLAQEALRRISAEMQASKASMALLQYRGPLLEQEFDFYQKKLATLTKEADGGKSSS